MGRRKLEVRALPVQMFDDPSGGLDGVRFEEELPARQLFHVIGEELVYGGAAHHRGGECRSG